MAMVVSILDASSGLGYGTRAGREEYGLDVDDIEPYPDASYKPRYTDYSRLNKTYDAIISNAVLNVSTTDTGEHILYNIAVIQEKEEAEISPHSGDGLDPEEGVPGKPYNHPPKGRVSQPDTDVKQKSDRDVEARDTEYLELAKDPTKNAARLQEMVAEAARAAGYQQEAWHQTGADFTRFNTDNELAGRTDTDTPTGLFFKPNADDIGIGGNISQLV